MLKNAKSDSKRYFKITLAPFLCAEVVNVFCRAAELLSGNAQDISLVQINFHLGPSLDYVRKIAISADVQYYLCWQMVDGWVTKSSKMC